MRASHGIRLPLVWLCVVIAAAQGCTWGSKNGVPWWGSKKEKEEAATNLDKYGPVAFKRVEFIKMEGKYAAEGGPQEKQKVADDLARSIQTEQDPLVRMEMVRTLTTIPNETAASVLYNGMKDPDPEVRVAVCEAWGKRAAIATKAGGVATPQTTETDAAARLLSEALAGDTNVDVRLAAARALGKVRNDPRAVGALGIALKDQDPALQFRAVASLKEVSGKDFGNDVGKWQQYVDSVVPPGQQPKAIAGRPQETK
jgi:HEAT repeat protein